MILDRDVLQNGKVRRAIIDVGSNSLLLTVEERRSDGWSLVLERTAVTALGEGTKSTGLLGAEGMNRSLAALRELVDLAKEHHVDAIQSAATMAVRIASNAQEFLTKAAAQGTPVSILSGEQEAALGFECVASDPRFSRFEHLAIVDPGGHSTELTVAHRTADGWDKLFLKSFPVGTLGLKSLTMPSESPGALEILATTQLLDDMLAPVRAAALPINLEVVVLGATGTNLVSIREGLAVWEPAKVHGAYLLFEEISRAVGWLMPMTEAERSQIVGMELGREKTLPMGALILERFLFAIPADGCWVSTRGWRYAMLEDDRYWNQ